MDYRPTTKQSLYAFIHPEPPSHTNIHIFLLSHLCICCFLFLGVPSSTFYLANSHLLFRSQLQYQLYCKPNMLLLNAFNLFHSQYWDLNQWPCISWRVSSVLVIMVCIPSINFHDWGQPEGPCQGSISPSSCSVQTGCIVRSQSQISWCSHASVTDFHSKNGTDNTHCRMWGQTRCPICESLFILGFTRTNSCSGSH